MGGVLEDEAPQLFDVATNTLVQLVSSAKSQGTGVVAPSDLFEVLQKLQLSIGLSERGLVKEHQRRAEDALVEVLLKGTAGPVSALHLEG